MNWSSQIIPGWILLVNLPAISDYKNDLISTAKGESKNYKIMRSGHFMLLFMKSLEIK